jgi:flagellar protein FliO/FliZ
MQRVRSDEAQGARESGTLPCSRVCGGPRLVAALASLAYGPLASAGASAGAAGAAVSGSLFAELLLIALIAACGWVVVYLVRRRTRAFSAVVGDVRVVGGAPLGPRERVVVLTAQGRLFLLGVTPQQVTMLTELRGAADDRGARPADFEALLAAGAGAAPGPAQASTAATPSALGPSERAPPSA